MKIQSCLNNLFDQYDVEENRITNAFLQTLAHSENILRVFLKSYFNINIKGKTNVIISSQKVPFALGDIEKDYEKIESIPDGWIIIDDEIAIVFESKITINAVKPSQLLAHARRVRGYVKKHLCVITPDKERPVKDLNILGTDITWIPWRKIYGLVSKERESKSLSGYLEKQLKEYLAMKEGLVGFHGIDYLAGSFNSEEAKIIMKNLIKEIKPDILKIYPKLKYERKTYSREIHSYTISPRGTWSFLGADESFTKDIHLTLWLAETHMGIGITVPNSARVRWKRLRAIFKTDDAFNVFVQKLFNLSNHLPNLFLEFVHRHYIKQRDGIIDGIIEINLDTLKGNKSKNIKANEKWLDVLRELVKNKRHYNGQFMLRTRFFYVDYPTMKTADFKDTIIEAAESFKEIYDYLQ